MNHQQSIIDTETNLLLLAQNATYHKDLYKVDNIVWDRTDIKKLDTHKAEISDHELRFRRKYRTFVQKLFSILSSESNSDIISWLPNGNQWMIHNKDRFIDDLLPTICKSVLWKSFLRQLSGWGFTRGMCLNIRNIHLISYVYILKYL